MRSPAISSLIYVSSVFGLIALIFFLSALGFAAAEGPGAIVGFGAGFFILLWVACWRLSV